MCGPFRMPADFVHEVTFLVKIQLYHTLTARILHWVNAAFIGLLIITGLYIRNPFDFSLFANMDTARKLHFISMYFVITGTFLRVYYSCINRDYRGIFFRLRDFKLLPGVIRYYLFLSDSLPGKGRYNAGQKAIYNGWVLLILFQAATGLMLYSPEILTKYSSFLGGPVMVRQAHFLMTWLFIITTIVHVYFAFLSGWSVVKSMFTGVRENQTQNRDSFSV